MTSLTSVTLAATLALGSFALPQVAAASTALGSNLIVNGDAEADIGSLTGGSIGPVTGFATTGEFTVIQYAIGGGYPSATDPGPGNRGANFFGGGNVPFSSGEQLIDIADLASAVDLGQATFTLSAYLGGFASQDDNAVLSLSFLDGLATTLDTASLGPVSAGNRNSLTGLLFREAAGGIPVGTRSILVDLSLTRLQGSANDGYADDLSLVLAASGVAAAVPEPQTWALLFAGLGAVGLSTKRSRKGR